MTLWVLLIRRVTWGWVIHLRQLPVRDHPTRRTAPEENSSGFGNCDALQTCVPEKSLEARRGRAANDLDIAEHESACAEVGTQPLGKLRCEDSTHGFKWRRGARRRIPDERDSVAALRRIPSLNSRGRSFGNARKCDPRLRARARGKTECQRQGDVSTY